MYRGEQLGFDENRPIPETQVPIKHTLPFEWGSLRVSEAADMAYELVPLTANFIKGSGKEVGQSEILAINIWLLAPEEVPEEQWAELRPFGDLTETWTTTSIDGKRIDIAIAHSKNRASISDVGISDMEELFAQASEATGIDLEDLLNSIEDEHGFNHEDLVRRMVPTLITHATVAAIQVETELAVAKHIKNEMDNVVINKVSLRGAVALGGAGVVLAPDIINGEGVSTPSVVISGTLAGALLWLGRRDLKNFLWNRPVFDKSAERIAETRGFMVGQSVHEAYCPNHFDRVNEAALQESDLE